ncbi:hypothetical protein [Chryseobacterium salviniae]|uniref:Uncharacterized protein n=1 Tax=Chryseobacterium salviniae TaxID=3101750 RepID=A0ABU6HT88_9FLAO|nr:hypothetical protein [Chryseobacterium sp. T9W2-O]MEC3875924.1 hypothetical protein [Chryseobacterium sp. T9W2-O]
MADLTTIFSWFETGDIPTQEQFRETFSSFRHKDALLNIAEVSGLENALNNKLGASHSTDVNAHNTVLAKLDASNLNYDNIQAWRNALDVESIPNNVGLVDDGLSTEVFNKDQIRDMVMMIADYVQGGKIRADKIEALGLTELIIATQTSLASFMANNANYQYEKNDIIAIADISGNYSLYIYKGGSKTTAENYIPTGLTNITIAMVQGLQAALDAKIDKPTAAGNYVARFASGSVTWRAINPASNYLTFWNGADFTGSSLFFDGTRYGIGTTTPSEMLHLTGRARVQAVVLNDNPETLPQQLTYNAKRFFGSDDTGIKRPLMFSDNADFLALANSLTEAQKTTWKTVMNGGGSTGTMSVAIITPPVVDKQDKNYWLTLKGANLSLSPANFSVQIVDSTGTNVVATIPNSQVQLYTNGIDLTFYYNFKDLPIGQYRIRLNNGVATMTTGAAVVINVVSTLSTQDLSSTTWNIKTFNDFVSPLNTASGSSFGLSVDANVKALASDSTFIVSALSSSVIPANTNFYLECSITIATAQGGSDTTGGNVYFGITGVASNNILSLLPFLFYRGRNYGSWQSNNGYRYPFTDFYVNSTYATVYSSNAGFGMQTQQLTNKIIIQRIQNAYTILFINTTANVVTTLNATGSTDALRLVAQLQNHAYDSKISGNIETLYLF